MDTGTYTGGSNRTPVTAPNPLDRNKVPRRLAGQSAGLAVTGERNIIG